MGRCKGIFGFEISDLGTFVGLEIFCRIFFQGRKILQVGTFLGLNKNVYRSPL